MFINTEYIVTLLNGIMNQIEKLRSYVYEKTLNVNPLNIRGASVGQTVKITEVDENGSPTAWEAVDSSSSGSGGIETVYICAGVGFKDGGVVSYSDGLTVNSHNYVTFAEAEELYQKWMADAVNIIAILSSSLTAGGKNVFGKVIGMAKEAADSSGSTYRIGFSVATSSGLHTAYVAHDQT